MLYINIYKYYMFKRHKIYWYPAKNDLWHYICINAVTWQLNLKAPNETRSNFLNPLVHFSEKIGPDSSCKRASWHMTHTRPTLPENQGQGLLSQKNNKKKFWTPSIAVVNGSPSDLKDTTQGARNVKTTTNQRWCNALTPMRRRINVMHALCILV